MAATQQSRASAHPQFNPSTKPAARRMLAENVVYLFAEDRPPVINRKRRGRLPSGIAKFRDPGFLRVGAIVEDYFAEDDEWKLAEILSIFEHGRNPRVELRALGERVILDGIKYRYYQSTIKTLRRSFPLQRAIYR